MSELPPLEERLTLREASELLGKSIKAVQQLAARGSLRVAKESVNPRTGRASRVVTSRAWIEEYLGERLTLMPRPWREEPPPAAEESYWQELAERQAIELIRLRAELAELRRRV